MLHAENCAHCGGPKDIRNPTGKCDHLYWPDNLTDEAKRANGYRQAQKLVWINDPADGVLRQATYDPQG
jgi:hypothetical protein